ncbi:S-layer homology domain-containing protein [Bacillus mycoides]|uniref:S-layer homology domain-containing protein n=1 Tax=Bacillus mycoides TaxID=1405 RepID=UPI003CFF23F5
MEKKCITVISSLYLAFLNKLSSYADLKDHWGTKYANILIQENISVGTDNGWAPDKSVSRAEAAQFIAKTDKLKK